MHGRKAYFNRYAFRILSEGLLSHCDGNKLAFYIPGVVQYIRVRALVFAFAFESSVSFAGHMDA